MQVKYSINKTNSIFSDQSILDSISTDIDKDKLGEFKEICHLFDKKVFLNVDNKTIHCTVVYTLNTLDVKNSFCIQSYLLNEKECMEFNRLGVIRDGKYIDLLDDANIRNFDIDDNIDNGVINNTSKLNIKTNFAIAGDIGVIEYTLIDQYKDIDYIKKDFVRYDIVLSIDKYFLFDKYNVQIINNTKNILDYHRRYIDSNMYLENESERGQISQGDKFEFIRNNWCGVDCIYGYPEPIIEFSTNTTWQNISQYVYKVYENTDKNLPAQYIQDIFGDCIRPEDIDINIQKAIEYVQDKIQYVFDSDEMGGFVPQSVEFTLKSKTGDCKAKSLLLQQLLKHIGVKSNLILVNYDNCYIDQELPSPFVFNHIILEVYHNDIVKFVDPTYSNCRGRLQFRSELLFTFFLRLAENGDLEKREKFKYKLPCVESFIELEKVKNTIKLKETSNLRGGSADSLRGYYHKETKENFKRQIANMIIFNLDNTNLKQQEIEDIINTAEIKVISDNVEENIFTYELTLSAPVYKDKDGVYSVKYYDQMFIHQLLRGVIRKDVPFVLLEIAKKQTIYLKTGIRFGTFFNIINAPNLKICDENFEYTISSKYNINSIVVDISYSPYTLAEVQQENIEKLMDKYMEISKSNYGVGFSRQSIARIIFVVLCLTLGVLYMTSIFI